MSTRMRVDSITLNTAERDYSFPFTGSCTLLDGPVGTGKSSLLELIKYALGGSAVLTPVVRAHVAAVEADVSLDGEKILLRRSLGGRESAYVDVLDQNSQGMLRLAVRPQIDQQTISDFLLESLSLPKVKIPRARTRATAANVPLTFNDLFAYLYVEQREIDRSVVHHTESFREPKRRAIFELMFGLSDTEQLAAETELGQVRDALRDAQRRVDAVVNFLHTAQVDDEETLRTRAANLRVEANQASNGLAALRSDLSGITEAHSALRTNVLELEDALRKSEVDLQGARSDITQREHLLAQLHLDLGREDKARSASRRLSPLEFITCPRCLQDLDESRGFNGHCILCLQSVENDAADDEAPGEETDLQIEELAELLVRAREDLSRRELEHQRAENSMRALRSELDSVTADVVSPRFQEIEVLSGQRARALAGLESIEQLLAFHSERRNIENEMQQLQQRRDLLDEKIKQAKSRLIARRTVLDDLSDLFDETVKTIGVPWATSARIDPKNYLPLVNGEPFETLSVAGGTKTVVTVAYHLTLLSYALAQGDILLPQILILDTPRKNLGFNESDSEMGARIYSRIRTLTEAYGSNVQFIVADNDVPDNAGWMKTIHFDYEEPLIRHVLHPGEDAVLSGQLETVGATS